MRCGTVRLKVRIPASQECVVHAHWRKNELLQYGFQGPTRNLLDHTAKDEKATIVVHPTATRLELQFGELPIERHQCVASQVLSSKSTKLQPKIGNISQSARVSHYLTHRDLTNDRM